MLISIKGIVQEGDRTKQIKIISLMLVLSLLLSWRYAILGKYLEIG